MVGDYDLRLTQTLHTPAQATDYIYLQWGQIVVPDTPEFDPTLFESWSCALRYNSASLKEVTASNYWLLGYRGEELF